MSSYPIIHEIFESIRFGRVLFAELAPPDSPDAPCRYCRLLAKDALVPSRGRFSNPESSAKAILDQLGSGEAPDRVILGGPGDPLREIGIASVLRRIRSSAHLGAVILTDGALLSDRDARRDAGEADAVAAWIPALVDTRTPARGAEEGRRRDAFDRHVAGIAALRRETQTQVILEVGVRPGENDTPESLDAWKRAIATIHPHRVQVFPAAALVTSGPVPFDALGAALERVQSALGSGAGVALADPSPVDRRCYCETVR
jgi:wyosine [tRNA(Phe)-imidazoG37] synthetase (radical SAM superfamily)